MPRLKFSQRDSRLETDRSACGAGCITSRHRSWRAATCVGRCVSRTAGLPRRNHVRLSPVQHTDSIPHNSKICSYSSCNTMVPSIARPSTANVDEKKTTYKSEL
ncbi:hypothetical protein PI125_g21576 [Phytophthora idaei]|nr:hypothetical protein PI125_g21576 [Phytophthora idaei]